jgi:glutathione S-transferase
MDESLKAGDWLAGDGFSLADLAYAPYMTRLMHLGLDDMVNETPRVLAWQQRLFARPSYKESNEKWFNPSYLEIFAGQRDKVRERARELARR